MFLKKYISGNRSLSYMNRLTTAGELSLPAPFALQMCLFGMRLILGWLCLRKGRFGNSLFLLFPHYLKNLTKGLFWNRVIPRDVSKEYGYVWWGRASQVVLEVKNPPARTGDESSIPGSGRAPGGGHGNPPQCSYLENPVDGGAWWAVVHGVARSLARLRDWAGSGEALQHVGVRARGVPLFAPGPVEHVSQAPRKHHFWKKSNSNRPELPLG